MNPRRRDLRTAFHIPLLYSALVLTFLLIGCATETSAPEWPTPSPLYFPPSTQSPTAAFATDPTGRPEPVAGGDNTPLPSGSSPSDVLLEVWSPFDGAETKTGAVRLMGKTQVDAAVAVNGIPVDVDPDGIFQRDMLLKDGPNLIEVVSTDFSGNFAYQSLAVFSTSSADEIPLSLFHPSDGLVVQEPRVTVIGGTSQDAIVAVNGKLVALNELGMFAADVTLEEGANTIEVITTDIQQRLDFRTVVVFYLD